MGLFIRTTGILRTEAKITLANLGGVDIFEPAPGGGKVDHAEEAVRQLIVAGGDGAVEMPEHRLSVVSLPVEHAVVVNLHAAV